MRNRCAHARDHATARLRSACRSTVSTCSRVTPGNHSRKSSTRAPSSRFSKRAFTGTRVPLKSHSPLTLPGKRSTTEQSFQSSTNERYLRPAALFKAWSRPRCPRSQPSSASTRSTGLGRGRDDGCPDDRSQSPVLADGELHHDTAAATKRRRREILFAILGRPAKVTTSPATSAQRAGLSTHSKALV